MSTTRPYMLSGELGVGNPALVYLSKNIYIINYVYRKMCFPFLNMIFLRVKVTNLFVLSNTNIVKLKVYNTYGRDICERLYRLFSSLSHMCHVYEPSVEYKNIFTGFLNGNLFLSCFNLNYLICKTIFIRKTDGCLVDLRTDLRLLHKALFFTLSKFVNGFVFFFFFFTCNHFFK